MAGELRAGDPQRMGPYRLLGRLGAGGMGQVFLGRSAGGRLVAVKVIRAELAEDRSFRIRFAREVAAARNVSGLFTAPVVDADTDGPTPWLATAYVAGPSLADAVEEHGPLPAASVLRLAAGLAEGLAAIHAAGVVHRDLKPSNVLLADDGPRVIDFGISRAAEASALTHTGTVVGTPGFMSPEQAEGQAVGPASDVFSLGTVLAFAATGQGPFGTGSTAALLYRVVHQPPDVAGLPSQLQPLIERCLAKDPAQRPSASGLLTELGGSELGADWLPAPLTETLTRYAPSGLGAGAGTVGTPGRAAVGPPPEPAYPRTTGGTSWLPTVTDAQLHRTPVGAAAQDGAPTPPQVVGPAPAGDGGDRPYRSRHRHLAWLLAIAALLAGAAAAGAAVLTRTPGGTAVTQSPPSVWPGTAHGSPPASRSPRPMTSTPTAAPTTEPPSASRTQPLKSIAPVTTAPVTTAPVTTAPVITPRVPEISSVGTYTQGQLVYFDIHYADPGHNAEGFGFVGVNGSGWAEENLPFSSPSYGIVGPGSIAYPFNQGCGTAQQYDSYVKAWIYDTAGNRSTPVVIHLVCPS